MNNYASSISGLFSASASRADIPPTEEQRSITKVAVLFTDIVGSTEFFKTYGDKQGKEMLGRHYNIARSIFSRFNGNVLKFIGDSIMASFIDPTDALRAAVTLQQKTLIHNRRRKGIIPIHIRVGIHYGEVIVEQGDIYGDVVNVASKLTNMAKGDEIYISSEVYDHIKKIGSIRFELLPLLDKKNIPEDLVVLRVYWDEDIAIDPEEDTIVYINPLLAISEGDFHTLWHAFVGSEYKTLNNKIKKKSMLSDGSCVFYIAEPSDTIDIAKRIIDIFLDRLNKKGVLGALPLQIAILTTKDLLEDEKPPSWLIDCLWDMEPGYIYIHEDTYFIMDGIEGISLQKAPLGAGSRKFYRYPYPLQENNPLVRGFPYAYALVTGPNRPCFYCGSKKHNISDCPSKAMPDYTCSAEKLGYYPIEKINSLFLKMILNDEQNKNPEENGQNNIAHDAIFEITRVYQLRFFRCIWNINNDNWLDVREHKGDTEGGLIWLSQDSIRISDLDKAESILNKAREEGHDNFRLYCAYGYLSIEKGDIQGAEDYFKKALSYAKKNVHKTFIGLLLARLYFLTERQNLASRIINEIITTDPLCVDGIYMDIKIGLRYGRESKALQQLKGLIENHRVFFVYAYLDYEFFPYKEVVAEVLDSLFKKAKVEAEERLLKAEAEYNTLKDISDKQIISEIEVFFLKLKTAMTQGSFFGYLDAKDLAETIILRCREILKEKKKKIMEDITGSYKRIKKAVIFLTNYQYKRFSGPCAIQLEGVAGKVKGITEAIDSLLPSEIEGIELRCREIDKELNALDRKIDNLLFLKRTIRAFSVFAKWVFFSLCCVLMVCFILLPLLSYYVQDYTPSHPVDFGFYQKNFFIWGSILGLIISAFVSIRSFVKDIDVP
ncbi:MAG: hypothetical protein KBE27_02150 [Syntrophorhabdaceae bacterium]|nr:hypothetical protein [Syntrophorhabdales bacterium]MBP9560606.1 hypothetical protein [Syntrophorhabdaceae bacterium]